MESNISIEDLYQQKHSLISNVVRKRLNGLPELWDDVEQEIWLAIVRYLPGFRGDSAIETWLYKLVNAGIADALRKEYRRARVYQARDEIDYDEGISWLESEDEFEHLLLYCPYICRDVIRERLWNGRRFTEIARGNEQTYDATRSSYRRGIRAMREELKGDNYYEVFNGNIDTYVDGDGGNGTGRAGAD